MAECRVHEEMPPLPWIARRVLASGRNGRLAQPLVAITSPDSDDRVFGDMHHDLLGYAWPVCAMRRTP